MITSAAVANSSLFILSSRVWRCERHSSCSIVQRYNIFRALPNFALRFGAIFSTNSSNFAETYYRTLESVISDPRVLLFADGERDASRVPPSHRPIKVGAGRRQVDINGYNNIYYYKSLLPLFPISEDA